MFATVKLSGGAKFGVAIVLCLAVAGCKTYDNVISEQDTKFSSKSYGVSASPRLAFRSSQLRKGTGTYKVGKPYKVRGRWYHPKLDKNYNEVGLASWYGPNFHGRKTANGEIYDMHHLSAAHPTMPLPSYARVTNLTNGRSVIVRVNDRGPFVRGRIIDLSNKAATVLDTKRHGVAKVRVKYIGPAPLKGNDYTKLAATYRGPSVDFGKNRRAKASLLAGLKQKSAAKKAEEQRLAAANAARAEQARALQLAAAEAAKVENAQAPAQIAAPATENAVFDPFTSYLAFFQPDQATGTPDFSRPMTVLNYAPQSDHIVRGIIDPFSALLTDQRQ